MLIEPECLIMTSPTYRAFYWLGLRIVWNSHPLVLWLILDVIAWLTLKTLLNSKEDRLFSSPSVTSSTTFLEALFLVVFFHHLGCHHLFLLQRTKGVMFILLRLQVDNHLLGCLSKQHLHGTKLLCLVMSFHLSIVGLTTLIMFVPDVGMFWTTKREGWEYISANTSTRAFPLPNRCHGIPNGD